MESSKSKKLAIGAIIGLVFILIVWAYFAFKEPKKLVVSNDKPEDTIDVEHVDETVAIEAKQRFEQMPITEQNEIRMSYFNELSKDETKKSFDEYLVVKVPEAEKKESKISEILETENVTNSITKNPLKRFFASQAEQVKPDAKTLKIEIKAVKN